MIYLSRFMDAVNGNKTLIGFVAKELHDRAIEAGLILPESWAAVVLGMVAYAFLFGGAAHKLSKGINHLRGRAGDGN